MTKSKIGVIGLAVMGKNLALNIESRGYQVSVFNRSGIKTDELLQESVGKKLVGTYSLQEFVDSLESPKRILIMVKAGNPVDDMIDQLKPLLSKGDILIDGGNSFFEDTIARNIALEAEGFHYIGTGVSGGEEGALNGPAIMPGGQRDAYDLVSDILIAISAKVGNDPCCAYMGPDGAGHYVKMVHNGIEYSDMQLISEAYYLMKELLGLTAFEMQEIFSSWNTGELDSYLIEITADILSKTDSDTGKPTVDVILDRAGHKGTGKWTSDSALALGVPTPGITEAVFARYLSAAKAERVHASSILSGPEKTFSGDKNEFIESIRKALYASKISSYAQGFALLRAAATQYNWALDYGTIAMIFRGGCIIRAQFLNRIKEAFDRDGSLANLMLDPYFSDIMNRYQDAWREVVATATYNGIATPALSSSLSYFDGYRSACLPANLLQAQRDYFGAHTFERVDKEGSFHYKWF